MGVALQVGITHAARRAQRLVIHDVIDRAGVGKLQVELVVRLDGDRKIYVAGLRRRNRVPHELAQVPLLGGKGIR